MSIRRHAANTETLPPGYELSAEYRVGANGGRGLSLPLLFAAIAALMLFIGARGGFFARNALSFAERASLTVFLVLLYLLFHELTHGLFIHALSGVKPEYAFKPPFLSTGSKVYFNKGSFIAIALAPVLLGAGLLSALLALAPRDFRFSLYIVLMLNFAGSAGDYLQSLRIARLAPDSLIRDSGAATMIYQRAQVGEAEPRRTGG